MFCLGFIPHTAVIDFLSVVCGAAAVLKLTTDLNLPMPVL